LCSLALPGTKAVYMIWTIHLGPNIGAEKRDIDAWLWKMDGLAKNEFWNIVPVLPTLGKMNGLESRLDIVQHSGIRWARDADRGWREWVTIMRMLVR
jgi:hypothetical protein